MLLALLMVLLHATAAVLLASVYFRRYAITRPPLGVFGLGDIAAMLVAIVVVPFLYIALPLWLVLLLIGSASFSLLYVLWEPVLGAGWRPGLLAALLVGADIGLARWYGALSIPFVTLNNVVLIMMAVGVTNLWAQSGMRARDLVVLGLGLAIYDYLATWQFSLMGDMLQRLAGLPLVPMFVWHAGTTQWLGLGLGDVLLVTVFPLVMRKAYGWTASIMALLVGLGALLLIMLSLLAVGVESTFPAMVALGPLMALQYAYWRYRRGPERTTRQYLQAEPAT